MDNRKTHNESGDSKMKGTTGWAWLLGLTLLILFISSRISFADDVGIWDNDTSDWTTTFADGDPIDANTGGDAYKHQLAVDSNGVVYVTYRQSNKIYLSRYDGTDVRIWDNDTKDWTTTFADGDNISKGNAADLPQLAIDVNNVVYIAYQENEGPVFHIYLCRYDGTDVRIWDNDAKDWTTTFADGDPIDTGTANSASNLQLAVDSDGVLYVTYRQFIGVRSHIYLSRYDGTDVRIWDNDAPGWTTTFADGDPIDRGTAQDAAEAQLAIDSTNVVYVTYLQYDGAQNHIYLSRYDGTDVRIWDNDAPSWTTTFADGDPIDTGAPNSSRYPQIAIDTNDVAYVTYQIYDGGKTHIYLSRYDGTDVRIWDNDAKDWTTTFVDGDPIDRRTDQNATRPQLSIDTNNVVYVTYHQYDSGQYHIYLSRYDGSDVRIWDNDAPGWTTTLADGDPFDAGIPDHAYEAQLAIDSNDVVYVTYYKSDGGHIYLNRYDGTDVRIWDNDAPGWTTTLADGDGINTGIAIDNYDPEIAIDTNGIVYVTYRQLDGAWVTHIHMSRYLPSATSTGNGEGDGGGGGGGGDNFCFFDTLRY